jgi:hypothetical protein
MSRIKVQILEFVPAVVLKRFPKQELRLLLTRPPRNPEATELKTEAEAMKTLP